MNHLASLERKQQDWQQEETAADSARRQEMQRGRSGAVLALLGPVVQACWAYWALSAVALRAPLELQLLHYRAGSRENPSVHQALPKW